MHLLPSTLLAMLLALPPVIAMATEAAELDPPAAKKGANVPHFKVQAVAEAAGRSGIDGSASSVAYNEYGASLEYLFMMLEVDRRDYDWRGGAGGAGDPWRSLNRIAPGVQYYRELGGQWGVWAKLVGTAGFEDNLSSRSWTYNPQLLGFYSPSQALTYYAGAGMLQHSVESVPYPVLGVAWNLRAERGLGAAIGFPETMVRYQHNDQLTLKFDFQWDIRTYSLAADNPLVAQGYVRTEDRIPGLVLEFTPVKGVVLSPGIRWYLGRSMTLYGRDKKEQASLDPHAAWAASFKIGYHFR